MKKSLEQAIEKNTEQSIETLRSTTLDELRQQVEAKRGRALRFTCNFPFIGRGNVMRDETVSRQEIEKQLDEAFR